MSTLSSGSNSKRPQLVTIAKTQREMLLMKNDLDWMSTCYHSTIATVLVLLSLIWMLTSGSSFTFNSLLSGFNNLLNDDLTVANETLTVKLHPVNNVTTGCLEYAFEAQCPVWMIKENSSNHLLKNIALVVHYENSNFQSAPDIYHLYHKLVGEIIFCGPGENDADFREEVSGIIPDSVVFIPFGLHIRNDKGNSYLCLPLAFQTSKLPHNFSGVISISDDILIDHRLLDINKTNIGKNWLVLTDQDSPYDVDTVT